MKNPPRIEAFLAKQSAKGHYARSDNEAVAAAVALLPPRRATNLLVRIVSHNAVAHLGGCADLLLRCSSTPKGSAGNAAQICTALLDVLPGDPKETAATPAPWTVREPIVPGLIVDLLTAAGRIDAGLATRAIEHLLAWPALYSPDLVLVPAALTLAGQASGSWPAVGRLREAVLQHLGRRIAEPLEPPKDFSRANPLTCSCPDCRDLGAFLVAPGQREWRLKALEIKRRHVEQSVGNKPCDIDLSTEKRGSPYTLTAVKNQASYERRVRQRRQDLKHVAALGG